MHDTLPPFQFVNKKTPTQYERRISSKINDVVGNTHIYMVVKDGDMPMFFRELETRRLYLRNISIADRDFVYAQFTNDLVNLHL